MALFPLPSKPMPIGYPLAACDMDGNPLREGDAVRIPVLPDWLIHDLPGDEVERLRAHEGRIMAILEIDGYGHLWFGEEAPWFCLRPDEVKPASG